MRINLILLLLRVEPVKTHRFDLAVDPRPGARRFVKEGNRLRRMSSHRGDSDMPTGSRVGQRCQAHSLEEGPTQSCYQRNGREGIAYLLHRYSFSACFSSKRYSFQLSLHTGAGNRPAIEWARLDLITKVSVHGVNRGCQVFLAVFYYRRSRGKLTLFWGHIGIFGDH